ncbi:uncharacterized protein B0T15DRAFT_66441 [Chaetomium strumarium]|uniref:C2H2-type domain-containing protein n=1 Tax=Chaetomium strumarium TaxID=1170767 RepID=A0AAJ0M723_9PEZI|nr:hypothetical protein B0T15DRAFT_66441 [Chaetomium strumarium]
MSDSPQHRAMHHAGSYTAAIHSGHNHGSHAVQAQPALTGQYVPCPYENKVIRDGTRARMVLLFIRQLLEELPVGEQVQQSYACPMTKCRNTFTAPVHVIQHLLSCPELASGEFDCDKCNTWHSFPTNEKDWTQWMGWRSPQSLNGGPIQRKQSFGSKMKETFALRKKDPARKQNPVADPHFKGTYATDARPGTAASGTPSTTFTSRGFEHHGIFPGPPEQGGGFMDLGKTALPHGLPEVNSGMFWPGFDASDLPSTVSSVAISSTADESPSEQLSQNTSQTTLFTTGLASYQPSAASVQATRKTPETGQFLFSTQAPFGPGLTSLPGHAPSISAMSLDEPLPMTQTPISSTELSPTAADGSQGWWGPKVEVGTLQDAPPSSGSGPCFPIQTPIADIMGGGIGSGVSSPTSPCGDASPYFQTQASAAHSMSRALSQESMQTGATTVFGTPTPERGGIATLSAHGGHGQHSVPVPGTAPPEPSFDEELVCDECQWKPRGVRENLKGYLRKHKNTHRGVRLACDVPGCVKTFSRLDNLKKHKKDKHGIDDTNSSVPAKRTACDAVATQHAEEEMEPRRPSTVESELRGPMEDYSMLWPALHF